MPRIEPITPEAAAPEARAELERQQVAAGRLTNLKRTLAHSPPALHALVQLGPLLAATEAFLGKRRTLLFAHSISAQNECLICSTFFRRGLIQAGEDPAVLKLDAEDRALVDYGRQLARDSNGVSDELFARLRAFLTPPQIVTLTAFAGLLIATNLVNNALKVDLDEYLFPFRE